jgi:hypothetical protein
MAHMLDSLFVFDEQQVRGKVNSVLSEQKFVNKTLNWATKDNIFCKEGDPLMNVSQMGRQRKENK